jgi:hypothetical protein
MSLQQRPSQTKLFCPLDLQLFKHGSMHFKVRALDTAIRDTPMMVSIFLFIININYIWDTESDQYSFDKDI